MHKAGQRSSEELLASQPQVKSHMPESPSWALPNQSAGILTDPSSLVAFRGLCCLGLDPLSNARIRLLSSSQEGSLRFAKDIQEHGGQRSQTKCDELRATMWRLPITLDCGLKKIGRCAKGLDLMVLCEPVGLLQAIVITPRVLLQACAGTLDAPDDC